MKLYRAMRIGETVLISNERAFENEVLKHDISFINEVYSHIVPTYRQTDSQAKRIIYSFTDDIQVAYELCKKHKSSYDRIATLDIEITDSALVNQKGIVFIHPVFELKHWVDLMAYEDHNEKLVISNVNYDRKVPLLNTLTYSRWGALSLARAAREYALICSYVEPTVLNEKAIEEELLSEKKGNCNEKFLLCDDSRRKTKIIEKLREQLMVLNVNKKRKNNLDLVMKEYSEELAS